MLRHAIALQGMHEGREVVDLGSCVQSAGIPGIRGDSSEN